MRRIRLAPCDFFLFPNWKKWLGGKRFKDNAEVIAAVEGYFGSLPKNSFKDGLMALERRWKKCIEQKGIMLKYK